MNDEENDDDEEKESGTVSTINICLFHPHRFSLSFRISIPLMKVEAGKILFFHGKNKKSHFAKSSFAFCVES